MTLETKIRGTLQSLPHGRAAGRARRGLRRAARLVTGRPLTVRFFHRVDDPESLLVAEGLARLADRYAFEPRVTIVPEPAADVDPEPDLALALARREAWLVARRFELPALPPAIDAPSPARIRLAQAILLDAPPGRDALDRVVETGRALFAGDGEALAALAKRHGTAAGPDLRPRLEASYRALRAAGHYAGATVIADGEVFHRVDRLALLEARLARRDDATPLFPLVEDPVESLAEVRGPKRVTVYASFQCPYSYIALTRLLRLARVGAFEVDERPVRPLVMRGLRVPPLKRSYVLMDASREASRYGIPFGPFHEPRDAGVQRAIFVWHEASQEGKGLSFMESALRGVWVDAADLEDDGDLTRIAARAGLGEDVVARALRNREGLSRVEAHREARAELGLWGVPSFEVGALSTWGQDRIPLLFQAGS
jgi:2-hydroxychromene-2-carboxylate isomerase